MRSDDPERTAVHEAGHAAMAYTLGRRVGMVSIRGGPDYFGIATYPGKRFRDPPGGVMAQLDRPLPLMNAAFRRSIETEIMVSLAGYVTVSLYGPYRGPGFEAVDPDEARAAQLVDRLTRAEAAHLADLEANGAGCLNDTEAARERTHGLVGDDLATIYLMALEKMTEQIARGSRFQQRARKLAAELLTHEVLSAKTVRRILAEEP